MPALTKQRARSSEDKELRKAAILKGAREVIDHTLPQDITVAQLAKAAALGKATLYSYFESKEAVLLAVFEQELTHLVDDMCGRLRGTSTVPEVSQALVEAVGAQRRYRRLAIAVHYQIEPNVATNRVVAHRRVFVRELNRGGLAVEAQLRALPKGSGAKALRRLHSLALGLYQLIHPENAADAMRAPEFAPLRPRFADELKAALTCLLIGMTDPAGVDL